MLCRQCAETFRVALNESPSEKEGKSGITPTRPLRFGTLNESPSEKEGKFHKRGTALPLSFDPQ